MSKDSGKLPFGVEWRVSWVKVRPLVGVLMSRAENEGLRAGAGQKETAYPAGSSRTVAGRFVIRDVEKDLIGRGGMGTLYRGINTESGTPVAIKQLNPDIVSSNPSLLQRFAREGEALRQLDHPNIVKMLATAEETDPNTGGTAHFLVMQYVSGGSLRDLMEQQGQMPIRRVLEITLELSDALARAHHLGIIHRDLKPANVLLAADGTPRLSDFGVAHLGDKPSMTQTGVMVGTVDYLSPEICNGEKPDVRSDLWAFGVLLFEMLSGQRPFSGSSIAGTLAAILTMPIADLDALRPDVDQPLRALVYDLLQKDRDKRIPSARQVGARLEAILQGYESKLEEEPPATSGPSPQPGWALAETEVPARYPQVAQPSAASVALSPTTRERRSQLILLDKVKRFWIHGVLDRAAGDTGLIDLSWEHRDDLIEHPWSGIATPGHKMPGSAVAASDTVEAFIESDRSLLILGAAGSGKTITLLKLARNLIAAAENSDQEPIPVILNLTSWAGTLHSIADWIVEELTAKYQIPRQIGRSWLESDALLLLLDAFDSVPESIRAECVEAINRFRELHGLSGLVICSRLEEYVAAGRLLKLGGAIEIRTLTPAQINGFLAGATPDLAPLRTAFQSSASKADLLNMASSPLMLNVMSVALREIESTLDGDESELSHLFDPELGSEDTGARRRKLFEVYVQRMFARHIGETAYSPDQTQQWLTWLARKLFGHNMTLFLIEQLQPSWLGGKAWRWAYVIIHRFIFSLFAGVMAWMVIALNQIPLIAGASNLVTCIALCSICGMGLAAWDGYQMVERGARNDEFSRGDPRRSWKEAAVIGMLVACAAASALALFDADTTALAYAALWIGAFHIFMTHNAGKSLRNQITTSEALTWSWSSAKKGLAPGLAIGAAFALVTALSLGGVNWQFVINMVMPWVLVLVLFNGLRGRKLAKTDRPNQGIWLSLRNGTYAALLIGSIFGLYFLAILLLSDEPIWPSLVMGGLLALGAAQKYGGGVIEHAILRLLLWRQKSLPRDLIPFFDHAAGLILLHKVGGGYIFMHRPLQEYFAALAHQPSAGR